MHNSTARTHSLRRSLTAGGLIVALTVVSAPASFAGTDGFSPGHEALSTTLGRPGVAPGTVNPDFLNDVLCKWFRCPKK